jgi:hypothetical protein
MIKVNQPFLFRQLDEHASKEQSVRRCKWKFKQQNIPPDGRCTRGYVYRLALFKLVDARPKYFRAHLFGIPICLEPAESCESGAAEDTKITTPWVRALRIGHRREGYRVDVDGPVGVVCGFVVHATCISE